MAEGLIEGVLVTFTAVMILMLMGITYSGVQQYSNPAVHAGILGGILSILLLICAGSLLSMENYVYNGGIL